MNVRRVREAVLHLLNLLWNREKFVKNGAWMLGLNLLRQILGLVATVILVRIFSQEQFGHYQTVLSVVGICGAFTLNGLAGAVTQSVARGYEGTYRKAQLLSVQGACVGALVMLAIAIYFWLYLNRSVGYALGLAALLFPFFQGLLGWQALQAGRAEFKATAVSQSIFLIFSYGLTILAALTVSVTILIPVAIYYLTLSVQNVRMTIRAMGSTQADSPVEAGIIQYGVRMSLYDMFNIAGNHFDKIILLAFLSPRDLAVYAVASRIPELLKDNLQSIRLVLIPGLSRKKAFTQEINKQLNILSLVTSTGLVAIAVTIIPWAFPLIFSAKYHVGTFYCQLLVLSVAIGTFATTKYTFVLAKMDEKGVRNITIYANVVRIIAAGILVAAFGVLGAVLSVILYRVTNAALVQAHLRKHYFQADDVR